MGALCSCFSTETLIINGFYFKIVKNIGEGGFSYVQLAEDVRTGKQYAIKRLLAQEDDQIDLAKEEVKFYKLFTTPHIIPLIDYSITRNGTIAEINLVLPYYKNGSLQDEIERLAQTRGYIKERRIYQIFRGVCRALHVMHNYPTGPLAHRDVKPGNIMLNDDGGAVLMDFGSVMEGPCKISSRNQALAMQELAAERSTMPYRAPELFEVPSECVIDEKVDVWSLGCTLYSMAFLQSPFEWSAAESGGSVALAVLGRQLKFPDTEHYSQGLIDLIGFILEVDPVCRPDVDTVLQRLDALESNTGFSDHDVSFSV